MHIAAFRRAGHTPTLAAAFLHFDVSFMCWTLLAALGVSIADDFGLSASQKALMVAVPLLAGSCFRIVVGVLADRFGPRRVGICSLACTAVPLLYGWLGMSDLHDAIAVGCLLGVAGASFAVSLPLASRWYPAEYQGVALGLAGAGNSGTILATLFAPRLAGVVGWQGVFGLALIPLAAVFTVFVLLSREAPAPLTRSGLRDYATLLGQRDTWLFCAFYSVTFGGFVGLASFLPIFMHDQYDLGRVSAGNVAAACGAGASLLRPFGGWLADRIGGTVVLIGVYAGAGVLLLGASTLQQLPLEVAIFWPLIALLGIGNGAVFQLVPLRFPRQIGVVTGLVGAAGGIGGFALAYSIGLLRDATGTYGTGLAGCGVVVLLAFAGSIGIRRVWLGGWAHPEAIQAAV